MARRAARCCKVDVETRAGRGFARKVIDGDIRQASGTDSSASGQRQDEKDEKDENVRRRGKSGRKGVGDWLDRMRRDGRGCQVARQHLT